MNKQTTIDNNLFPDRVQGRFPAKLFNWREIEQARNFAETTGGQLYS